MHTRTLAPLFLVLILLSTHSVSAQDATLPMPPDPVPAPQGEPLRKPLDAVRERVLNAQQIINDSALEARQELLEASQTELGNASSGPERKDILIDAASARRGIMEARQASSTALRASLKDAALRHGGQIRQHFVNAVRHLKQFMTRIDSRIEKMKAAGTDVTALEAMQAEAETAIKKAENDIKAVQDYVATITDQSDRSKVRGDLESLIKTARSSIKRAHDSVRALVSALVKASTPTSSSTNE